MQAQANYKMNSRTYTCTPGTSCSLFMTPDKRQGHLNPVWKEVRQIISND